MTTRARSTGPSQPHHRLEIIPLGGLGEFGRNCTAFRFGPDIVVVDIGLMFPEEQVFGVNFAIPDLSYLFEHRHQIRAILLTHGHEDHIGALPYLYKQVRVPIYGTDFTLGLAARKLREHRLPHERQMKKVRAGDRIRQGPFEIEFIQVTHSIPGALALAITTPVGTIIHTADFKMDQTPIDGRIFDFQSFSAHGDRGVLALLSDSTNAEVEGFTESERIVGGALDTLFRSATGRIVLSTFASNVHRVQQVIDVAAAHHRKVALVGTSMSATAKVAESLGYLKAPAGLLVNPSDIKRLAPHRTMVIAAGSQGEPMSALSRIALDNHPHISIGPGDLVVISARAIPGNEKSINRVINHVYRRGADVVFGGRSPHHVSGHASREELKIMLNLTRPRFFVPIHGELRQLHAHAGLAESTGLARNRILMAESGDVIELDAKSGRVGRRVQAGRVFIDGTLEEVDEIVVRDRRHISARGIVLAIVAIDKQTGKIQGEPEIVSRGFVLEEARADLLGEASRVVRRSVEGATIEERADRGVVKSLIQRDLKRYFRRHLDRRPLIIPAVIET
ncbi:MAG: ribonuclease J [Acidobacteria bacterium]|nr:ribonuclease J [Acidobacteriota bacterium]